MAINDGKGGNRKATSREATEPQRGLGPDGLPLTLRERSRSREHAASRSRRSRERSRLRLRSRLTSGTGARSRAICGAKFWCTRFYCAQLCCMADATVLTDEIAASMRANATSEDADEVDTYGEGTGLRVREGGRGNETKEVMGGR